MLTLDLDRLAFEPGDLVLDLGAGLGRHSFEVMRRGGRVVAVDLRHGDMVYVRSVLAAMSDNGAPPDADGGVAVGNALSLPFADGTFDRVIASEILEHIPDDTDAMTEIARVCKPGGTLAITVPRAGQEVVCWALSREYHDTPGGHVRIYRQRQIIDRLKGAGLRPRGIGFAHALHTPYWWLRCAVGPTNEGHRLVKAYRSFLEWDITNAQPFVRLTERVLNPVLGKSLVVYLAKPQVVARV